MNQLKKLIKKFPLIDKRETNKNFIKNYDKLNIYYSRANKKIS